MITFSLNDAPYGGERSYNGLRLAMSLIKIVLAGVFAMHVSKTLIRFGWI